MVTVVLVMQNLAPSNTSVSMTVQLRTDNQTGETVLDLKILGHTYSVVTPIIIQESGASS